MYNIIVSCKLWLFYRVMMMVLWWRKWPTNMIQWPWTLLWSKFIYHNNSDVMCWQLGTFPSAVIGYNKIVLIWSTSTWESSYKIIFLPNNNNSNTSYNICLLFIIMSHYMHVYTLILFYTFSMIPMQFQNQYSC